MKIYEIIFRKRNNRTSEYDMIDFSYRGTYAEAVKVAKQYTKREGMKGNDVIANVEMHYLDDSRISPYDTHGEIIDYLYSAECSVWEEAYKDGKQIPCVYIGTRPIWRWDYQCGDLKPIKEKIKH